MGEGLDADVTRQTRLLGKSRLPYLWGSVAGAALFGRRVMWRVGTVVALHDETATARTITLEVSDWPGHVAGQHVDVRLTASDGYSAVRSYSIASAPNAEKRVELTVERLPNGEVSPYLTQELAVGDRLEEFVSYNRARLPSPLQWVTVNRIRVKDSYTDMEFLSDEFSEKFVPIGFI